MESVNRNFKALRYYLRLKQIDFARELRMTQANVSQIENAECLPSGDLFIKLAARYPKLNFNWLIRGEGDMFKVEKGSSKQLKYPEIAQIAEDVRAIHAIVRTLSKQDNSG